MAFVGKALVCLSVAFVGSSPAIAQAAPPLEIGAPASAEPAPVDAPAPPQPAPPPASAAPPPYSIPWQLRPLPAVTVLRSDSSFASYEDGAARGGTTFVTSFLVSYRIPGTGGPGSGLTPLARVAMVNDSPPTGPGGLAVVNPLIGIGYSFKLGAGFRANAFLGATIPIGMGGGDSPSPGLLNARNKGVPARSAMDNALFAVNDFTVIPGIAIGYVSGGLTVQAEATVLQLTRVRGEKAQPEASKTNFTTGLHIGYFVIPEISIGADLRYQRWLNAPFAVEKDATEATRDTATFAIGPRYHAKIASTTWVRPGISYSRGLDKPVAAATPNYQMVQLDVPVIF